LKKNYDISISIESKKNRNDISTILITLCLYPDNQTTMTYRYIQTEKNEDGQYGCYICGHTFEDEGEVCWADELYEGEELSQATGRPLCGDCCDEVRELANREECECCCEMVCCDDMETIDDKLLCPECYEKELAKKQQHFTINAATFQMYDFTIAQFDQMDDDHHLDIDADSVREFWQNMLHDHSDCFDIEWFALIGTAAIEKTINWHFIARKYQEKRIFQMEHIFAE